MENKQLLMTFFLCFLSFFIFSCDRPEIVQVKSNQISRNISSEKTQNEIVKLGTIKRGQGFHQALRDLSIHPRTSLHLINGLRDYVEFSKLRVGDKLQATFNSENKLTSFTYSQNPAEKHILKYNKVTKSWDYEFFEAATEWSTRTLSGELKKDSNLQSDLLATGLQRSVVAEIVNVLLCKVNFRVDARMGDKYKILLNERIYKKKVLETEILYTSYLGIRAGKSEAYFYNDGDKKSTYTAHYTEEGEALIRSGLRYPLSRLHIRSRYGMRRHPVTGRRTWHRGIDLRGRSGSPVYSVARGIVVESKYNPYGGNRIAIRHTDRSVSYYMHLKNRAVKVGDRIRGHQIIGRVGATGRVTGPHLHFGFKNSKGRWINPLSKRMIATPKLKGERYSKLIQQIDRTKDILAYYKYKDISRYVIAPALAQNFRFEHVIPKYFTL